MVSLGRLSSFFSKKSNNKKCLRSATKNGVNQVAGSKSCLYSPY